MDHRPPRPDQPYAWDDERLSAYLDGELSAPEQAQLEARLVVDPELRQLVDELRAVRQQLEILPEYRLKPTFADQVLRRAEQEMLLAPLGREATQPVAAAAAPLIPALPAAPAQPVEVAVSPARSKRLWRRGAIWTAIAAAAVLLLIVTNRPNAPQQDHVAKHDLPDATSRPADAKNQPIPATTPDSIPQAPSKLQAMAAKEREQEGLAKASGREAQQFPLGQPTPSVTTVVGAVPDQNTAPASPATTFGAAASPKQASAADAKQTDSRQLARSAGGDKPAANQLNEMNDRQANSTLPGKPLLKSKGPDLRKGIVEKQAGLASDQLTPELQKLLASAEFSRLAYGAEGSAANDYDDKQVVVVRLTPRDLAAGEGSFAALLANNSIGLGEKSLQDVSEPQRQRSVSRAKPEARDAQPSSKAALKDELDAGAKDQKAAAAEQAKAENSNNGIALRKEPAPEPASDALSEGKQALPASELYYLEADSNQVDHLLRQIRSSSAQFSRLNIMPQPLVVAESRLKNQDEKSLARKQDASPQKAGAIGDDARDEPMPFGDHPQFGNQSPSSMKQLAQGPLPPAAATPVPPPAPVGPAGAAMPAASAPAPVAPATPVPTAEPFAAPTPFSPQEIAAAPAAAARPNAAALGTDGASTLGDAKGGFGQSADGTNQRRAVQADKSLRGANDRVIAYRLRGVETLLPDKSKESATDAYEQGHGVGGGGAGGVKPLSGKSELDKLRADPAQRGSAPKAAEPGKPSDSRLQMQAEGGPQKFDAAKSEELKSGDAAPGSQPLTEAAPAALDAMTQDKKLEHPRSEANSAGLPKLGETSEQDLERSKNAALAGELSLAEGSALAGVAAAESMSRSDAAPTESAKKSAPAPEVKRVRVLFVIEHEAP